MATSQLKLHLSMALADTRVRGYLLATIILLLVTFFMDARLTSSREQILKDNAKLHLLNQIVQSFEANNNLLDRIGKSSKNLSTIEEKLGRTISQSHIYSQISQLASHYSLAIKSQSFKQGKVEQSLATMHIRVEFIGNYAKAKGFINDLNNLDNYIVVNKVVMSSTSGGHLISIEAVGYGKA